MNRQEFQIPGNAAGIARTESDGKKMDGLEDSSLGRPAFFCHPFFLPKIRLALRQGSGGSQIPFRGFSCRPEWYSVRILLVGRLLKDCGLARVFCAGYFFSGWLMELDDKPST